jgi:hypothetical protein
MPPPNPTPDPAASAPKKVFTTPGRMLILASLIVIAAAMYWVITTETIEPLYKMLAGGGVLLFGCLAIAAGIHFWDGRHRR